jgi:hypothetical protein
LISAGYAASAVISCMSLHVHADIRPAILDCDPVLLQQLVTNLVDNAVRHNVPGGDIWITTNTTHAGPILSVTSSGHIIPAIEVDRLFQPFQRLGLRPGQRDGGHGLGLSIVRAIATAHAATIAAQPRPGGGLAIHVTFPPPPAPRTAPSIQPGTSRDRNGRVSPTESHRVEAKVGVAGASSPSGPHRVRRGPGRAHRHLWWTRNKSRSD